MIAGQGKSYFIQECDNWQVPHVLVGDPILMQLWSALSEVGGLERKGTKRRKRK